jgi:hypothetical protein
MDVILGDQRARFRNSELPIRIEHEKFRIFACSGRQCRTGVGG